MSHFVYVVMAGTRNTVDDCCSRSAEGATRVRLKWFKPPKARDIALHYQENALVQGLKSTKKSFLHASHSPPALGAVDADQGHHGWPTHVQSRQGPLSKPRFLVETTVLMGSL